MQRIRSIVIGALTLAVVLMMSPSLHNGHVTVGIAAAQAQSHGLCPPLCGPPPTPSSSATPDTTDRSGSRWKFTVADGVQAGATVAGDVILYVGKAKPSDYLLWNLGSAFAGPVGGGGLLAVFQEDQGLFTKLFRPGGFKCQPQDVGYVAGCKQWLDAH